VVVSLIDGDQRTTGIVIGADPAHDLALVQASRPLNGYQFATSDKIELCQQLRDARRGVWITTVERTAVSN
jgi:hypothetical protein